MWNGSVERELMRNTVLAFEYSGSRGLKQYSISSLNQSGFGCIYGGDAAQVPCDQANTGTAFNRLQPQYTNINFRGNQGDSWYNALNTRLQTNNLMNSGVTLTANYTWAHAIDTLSSTFSELNQNNNLGFLDPFNPQLDKGDADFDVRHRIVVSGTWDVPAFKDQKGAIGRVLGGWQIAPIFVAQTGYPFTVYDCTTSAGDASCIRYIAPAPGIPLIGTTNAAASGPNTFPYITLPGQPNFGLNPSSGISGPYGNPITGFGEQPTCAGFGGFNCSFPAGMTRRNAFRQPGIWNLNFSASKNFKLTERVGMQLRGELYNALNHSNFYVQTGGPFNNGGAADVSSSWNCDPNTGVCIPGAYTVPGKRGSTPTTPGSLGERRFVQLSARFNF
jgi:hypothetical protein